MSPYTETTITIGKAVLLQLHQRNQKELMDDSDYIPVLKTVISGVVSTAPDPVSQRQIQQTLHEYARDLYMQLWISTTAEGEDPELDEGLETFDYIYEHENWPK
ncbi:hypothetical protein [Endozoicomonas ascidiicola]|uniref:hypothetical protein n=1 Tax=Endozoicomonas ascidiicola TaxID=1698521 RepID=UPI0008376D46|nr:hypothetical protein [Endozoicomonas ascidiicola]